MTTYLVEGICSICKSPFTLQAVSVEGAAAFATDPDDTQFCAKCIRVGYCGDRIDPIDPSNPDDLSSDNTDDQ